jgi:ribosomal protein S12 methylthiotransferase accessory factor
MSQGKGLTLEAAQVSGLMEAIEGYHAEQMEVGLVLGSQREVSRRHQVVDVDGLARLSVGAYHGGLRFLWAAGVNLLSGEKTLVPYEVVHTDFRMPLPTGSGAFLMSSNGLASGNHLLEATSHAMCEIIERDANTLFHFSSPQKQAARRLDLATVDDDACRWLLNRYEAAGIAVAVWETTSDVGVASFLCSIVEHDRNELRQLRPVSGSGCHPRRAIALARAMTEAAQGRLTLIAGSRDDLSVGSFDHATSLASGDGLRELIVTSSGARSFREVEEVHHETFEDDVRWLLGRLLHAGIQQVVVVNLTKPQLHVPVVRVVIPHLEAMSEVSGYVPGRRARAICAEAL